MKNTPTDFLIVSQLFPPETAAGANRVGALAKEISSRHSLKAITLRPGYPTPDAFTDVDLDHLDQEEGYKIIRLASFHPHARGLFRRAIAEIIMALRLGVEASQHSFKVILVSTPSMFLGPIGLLVGKMKFKKVVWDVRDLTWRYSRESVETGILGRVLSHILEFIMRTTLRRADLVVGVNKGSSAVLRQEHGVDKSKIITIENGVSHEFISKFEDNETRFTEGSTPKLYYIGLLGYNQSISTLLRVAERLPEVGIVIVGDGAERPTIEDRLKQMEILNIDLKPYSIHLDTVIDYYKSADILFAQVKDTPTLNNTTIGSKIYEYMATGRPIVYAGKGLVVEFLSTVGCAAFAEPENPDSITAAIQQLLEDPDRARRMGQKGRDYVKRKYVRENFMCKYIDEIESRLL